MKKFLKKRLFSDEKQFWQTSSHITEYGRPQVTIC